MTDIGPGDVVEAVCDLFNVAPKGTRSIVSDVLNVEAVCTRCNSAFGQGLLIKGVPVPPSYIWWCTCEWKKIGGSRTQTVARFAEDLNVPTPFRVFEDA